MTGVRARGAAVLALGAALAVGGCGGGGGGNGNGGGGGSAAQQATPAPPTRVEVVEAQGAKSGGFDAGALYASEAPGVVTVISLFGSGSSLDSLLGGGGGGGGGDAGVGSGFVLNGRGEIATNAHVVTQGVASALKHASEVYVEFADGNRVRAEILGADPNADVALLRVNPDGLRLRALPFGASDKVQVGEPVAAIGSPFGERQSLSVGVISAVDRSIESLTSFNISGALQTDAAINPGNSGGPLVNGRGQVIGINQQIKTNSGGGEGVGFAVPSNAVRRSLEMLRRDGEARYAYLGVSSVDLYPQLVERFDLRVPQGAWVQDVPPGGPADRAGLRGGAKEVRFQSATFRPGGDVITKVGDTRIEHADDLAEAISRFVPNEKVPIEVHRGGDTRTIIVRLGERPLDASQG
jgi:S1-C subfamily serine protease